MGQYTNLPPAIEQSIIRGGAVTTVFLSVTEQDGDTPEAEKLKALDWMRDLPPDLMSAWEQVTEGLAVLNRFHADYSAMGVATP